MRISNARASGKPTLFKTYKKHAKASIFQLLPKPKQMIIFVF